MRMAVFMIPLQSPVPAIETRWPARPEIFPMWHFTDKICLFLAERMRGHGAF